MVFYRPLDQMYLSTHPPFGFWMDRWSRDQPQPGSLFKRPREAEKRDPGNEVDSLKTAMQINLWRQSGIEPIPLHRSVKDQSMTTFPVL